MTRQTLCIGMAEMGNPEQFVVSGGISHSYSSYGGKLDVVRHVLGYCNIILWKDCPSSFPGHKLEVSSQAAGKLGKDLVGDLGFVVNFYNNILDISRKKFIG